jgi:uncharacterized MAPEG superfamily protein
VRSKSTEDFESAPYVLTLLTKAKGFTPQDNKATRAWQAGLTGWRQRAYWAHQNGFEALPLFFALVITAHLAQPGSSVAALAAWAFVATRIVYSACFLADLGGARTLAWMCSHGAQIALILVALSVL